VLHRQKICLSRRHTNRAVCILIIWENLVLNYSDFLSANILSRFYGTVCKEAVLSDCECEKMKVPMHAQDLNGN